MDSDSADYRHWLDHVRRVHEELRSEMRRRFDRDLPIEELLFDRWQRARDLGFGERASIYHNSYVYGRPVVGADTWIGPFTLLDATGGLTIGRHCSISAGVQIYTHDSVEWAVSGDDRSYPKAAVSIGDCCYIGPQTVIAKGVTIGEHCVVGAHSYVDRDIEPYSVAFGTPCRVRGRVHLEDGNVRIEYFAAT